jgi:hypothetical protein
MINVLKKLSIERLYLNIIKSIYGKSMINVLLNEQNLKAFSLRSGSRQNCPGFLL